MVPLIVTQTYCNTILTLLCLFVLVLVLCKFLETSPQASGADIQAVLEEHCAPILKALKDGEERYTPVSPVILHFLFCISTACSMYLGNSLFCLLELFMVQEVMHVLDLGIKEYIYCVGPPFIFEGERAFFPKFQYFVCPCGCASLD